jgi:hypothetical protein
MGGLLVFYLLLKAGGMVRPAVPTLVFGLATFSVHMGHEARGYAQALLFVLLAALLALLSAEVSLRGARCRTALAVATGLSCGAALWTNYLSLFPVIAILLWSFLGLRRHRSHRLAVLPIIVMALVSLPLLGLLPMQLGARPLQEAGRPWWHDQTLLLAWMNLSDFHTLMFSCHPLQYAVWGLVSILVLVSFVLILRRWQHEDSRFHLLMLGLALSPSLGIVLLNLIFDKHLSTLRYVGLGLPGLSVLVSYWPNTLLDSKRKVGAGILALLLLAQFTGVNLGLERTPGQGDTRIRSTVEAIESLASPLSQVVVIGAGSGRGYPGSVIHELSPETMMAVLYGWGFSDVDALGRQVATFEQVCMMYSLEIASWDAERAFVAFLTTNGGYEEAFRIGTATCFHRTTPVESPGE